MRRKRPEIRRFFRHPPITQNSSTEDDESRLPQGARQLALAFESCQNRRSILSGNAASSDSVRQFRLCI
jgi:hypothetical protein